MSHEEERANGCRMPDQAERAPPHWLNRLVGRLMEHISALAFSFQHRAVCIRDVMGMNSAPQEHAIGIPNTEAWSHYLVTDLIGCKRLPVQGWPP
jgi:hypothetical protein